jgi:hypothetical protein
MEYINNNGIIHFAFPNGEIDQTKARVKDQLNRKIRELNEIQKSIDGVGLDLYTQQTIDAVLIKFWKLFKNYKGEKELTASDLNVLTYGLTQRASNNKTILESQDALDFALLNFNEKWNDRYIVGLFHMLLSNWDQLDKSGFSQIHTLFYEKIKSYSGRRKDLQSIRQKKSFYSRKGASQLLGEELVRLGKSNLLSSCDLLTLPEEWFTLPYFEGVIEGFVGKVQRDLLSYIHEIELALEQHGGKTKGSRVNKIVVSKMIVKAQNADESFQIQLMRMGYKLVGDPAVRTDWMPHKNATDPEKILITKACEILNDWLTREFITVFFEKCIPDERRKVFWLEHSRKIKSLKVYGPSPTKRVLKSDQRISGFVDSRFNETDFDNDETAFVFFTRDYSLIEFSTSGAFRAFPKSSKNTPNFERRIGNVSLLRGAELPMLVKRDHETFSNFKREGRLFHKDGKYSNGSKLPWELVFEEWMKFARL